VIIVAVYLPSDSLNRSLDSVRLNRLQAGTLRLFVSNHTPVPGDLAATYAAIECAAGGYAAITTNSWAAVAQNAANQAETDEIVRTWTFTGSGLPVTIYGVFFLDVGGNLMFAELNPTGGITITAAGQTFSYQPVMVEGRI
jgi:hypothetical protein